MFWSDAATGVERHRQQAYRSSRPLIGEARTAKRGRFLKPPPNVRRVTFIATPHRGSYLTEYSVAELLGRFITLPARIIATGAEFAWNPGDFKAAAKKRRRAGTGQPQG